MTVLAPKMTELYKLFLKFYFKSSALIALLCSVLKWYSKFQIYFFSFFINARFYLPILNIIPIVRAELHKEQIGLKCNNTVYIFRKPSYKIDSVIVIKNFLNPEGHQNPISGSKVTAMLLKGWILPIGGVASGRVCACSLRSRLVTYMTTNPNR